MKSRNLIPAAFIATAAAAATLVLSSPAAALPDANTLMQNLGLSADEISQVQAGKFANATMKAASDRELVTAIAFQVNVPPAALMQDLKQGVLLSVDPNTIATGVLSTPATVSDFAKLKLQPDQVKAYLNTKPGDDLNLSTDEIAAFQTLGPKAEASAVEEQLKATLVARVEAYRAKGLSGIAPYARSDGQRSPAEELRIATQASANLKTYVPAFYELLLSYPNGKPPGAEDAVRWTLLNAHGVPTITLTQALVVPDGDARVVVQRQFYVSTGYNTEQAVAALLPVATGTVVVYGNRTSTDQVTGFGGGTKRSIGSKMLASQLQSIFEKLQAKAK